MGNPPLSNPGVTEKVNELYGLSEQELQKEIILINSDLKSWIMNNFDATTKQESFINGLSSAYTALLTGQLTRTLEQRWPVTFLPEEPGISMRSSKWIKSKEENEASEPGDNRTANFTGSLTITTGY